MNDVNERIEREADEFDGALGEYKRAGEDGNPTAALNALRRLKMLQTRKAREAALITAKKSTARWTQDATPNKIASSEAEKDLKEAEKAWKRAMPIVKTTGKAAQTLKIAQSVIWRAAGGDAVLRAGDVCILSGAGGVNKSMLTLEIAEAAAPTGEAALGLDRCGFHTRAGNVLMIGYEDAPAEVGNRLKAGGMDGAHIHIAVNPLPLWQAGADGESVPTEYWYDVWAWAAELNPTLIVIDPVSAALADVEASQTGPVRQFIRSLVEAASALNAGVLLVAHSTKEQRKMDATKVPGTGAISGNAAWFDGARSVLFMQQLNDDGGRMVECIKANYAVDGWAVSLRLKIDDGKAALMYEGVLTAAELAKWRTTNSGGNPFDGGGSYEKKRQRQINLD